MADNSKNREAPDNFVDRIQDFVDKRFNQLIAKNRDDIQVKNTNLNGYRSLGTFQIMQNGSSSKTLYVIGEPGIPIVSE